MTKPVQDQREWLALDAAGRWWRSPLPWLAALLVIYLLSPIGAFAGRLVSAHRTATPGVGSALAVSAETATIATLMVGVLGIPLAYLLARGRSRRSSVVGVAVQLPIALPPLISGIMLLYLVGPNSAVGRLFDGRLTDDRAGIVLAQAFVSAPFVVVAARSAFAAIDPAYDDVAATLGHGPWSRFARVAVPAALPGIIAGLLLAWLRGFGEFGATVVLAYHPYSLPVFSYVQFGSTGLAATMLPTAAALCTAVGVLLLAGAATKLRVAAPVRSARSSAPIARVTARRPSRLEFDLQTSVGSFTANASGGSSGCLALMGATGAGKSLTVRALAGVHRHASGTALLGGHDLTAVPPERRRVGYLPQQSCLLPHLRVRDQVRFGVDSDPGRAAYWIDRLDLAALADRRPNQLSGGEARRVALARALATDPDLLVLDEPFTGLDTPTRKDLRLLLRVLLADTRVPTVLVTHDPDDLALLADDVLVLDRGATLQYGPREELYRAPAGLQVARLLGLANAFEAVVTGPGQVQTEDGATLPAPDSDLAVGTAVLAVIDPGQPRIRRRGGQRGMVRDVVHYADHDLVDVGIGARSVVSVAAPTGSRASVGDAVGLDIPRSAVRLSALAGHMAG